MPAGPEFNSNSHITNDAHDEPNEQFPNDFGHTKQKSTVDYAMTSNITNNRNKKNSIVFNYSSFTLNEAMETLLNRGFNFSILPRKLDITQVFVDYKRYERSTIWKEVFHGEEQQNEREVPIFKTQKNNLPQNYIVPEGLKTFLSSVKSEITDPRNRNTAECNLPREELEALKDLINM